MRRTIICVFFLVLTVGPVTGLLIKKSAFFKERPFLSPLPAFSGEALLDKEFYRGLGGYLDDRNPFRKQLIMAKAWVDLRLFKSSPARNIHMGLKGWLYFKPGIHDFLKNDCNKKEQALGLARDLHGLELKLKKAGKRFVFIVAPDKVTIYPEYMGGVREANECGKNFYDLFLEALKKYPVKGFVRLDRALKEAKGPSLLYYRKGSHWNDRGAALISKLILEKLSTPEVSYRLPKIHFRRKRILSELSPMLAINLFEHAPFADKIGFSEDVTSIGVEPLAFFFGEWITLKTSTRGRAGRALLPKIIIYRDSFMTAPIKLLKGSFRAIYARWSNVFPAAEGADAKELASAKIVLIEVVERDLEKVKIRPAPAIKEIK